MKKSLFAVVSLLLIAAATLGFLPLPGDTPIAMPVKIIRDVSRKSGTVDWTPAKKTDKLYSGDQVRTGEKSIAIVKFLDGSMLRVRESSELEIVGTQKDGILNKNVNIHRGEFTFDINKQGANEKFTFSSPTSVAAIRGTGGTFNASDSGDILIVLEGLVNLLNSLSQKAAQVAAGQTAISNPDGSITVRQSLPEETGAAQAALNSAHNTGPVKSIDVEVKDQQGNKQKLRIKYHD